MANAFTLGGALGSALNSTSGYIKKITSPNDQTLSNLKTGVVSAVKNAPASLGIAANNLGNAASTVKNAVTNPIATTTGLINKAITPAPKPFVNTVQNTQGGITASWQTPTNTVIPKTQEATKINPGLIKKEADPIKKTDTITGSDTKNVTKAANDPSYKYDTSTGKLNTNYSGYVKPEQTYTNTQENILSAKDSTKDNTYVPPVYAPENTNLNAQAIADMANRSRQPIKNYDQIQAKLEENAAKQASLEREITAREANIGTSGVDLSLATGERGILSSKAQAGLSSLRSEASALSGMLGAANTQQQTQQSALGSAISSTMPGMQYGQMTNQQTGAPVAGGNFMSNPMLNASVNEAVRVALQSGPAAAQSLLNGLDAPGRLAFTQAMQQATGGTYNPTAMDTAGSDNVKIAQAFANTGTTINAAKQNIAGLSKQATDLIQQAGINTRDANWANEKINSYVTAESNPVAYRSLMALNNEAQKFLSTIAGSGSNLIPTQVTENIQGLNITDMSSVKLDEFLRNIQAIGTAQADTASSQMQGALGAGATGFYTGGNQGSNTVLTPGETNNSSALSKALVTGGLSLGAGAIAKGSGALDQAGSFLSRVFGK